MSELAAAAAALPAWQRRIMSGSPSGSLAGGGRGWGKCLAAWRAVASALERGEHVHVAGMRGIFCAGGDPECPVPEWDGEL